jgi:predicted MFS family arabinose efflux permease
MKRDFLLVLISLTTWGIGEGAFMYFQPLYLQELGASPIVIGSILGGMGLAMTIVHIPAGYLADRIGRRQLMWAAWLTGIVTTGLMALSQSLILFSAGLILYSLTLFVVAPLNSYATAARHNLTVEQALTTTTAGFNLGGIAGPLIGGTLANRFGLRSIYFFAFFVFILSALVIFQISPQPREETQDHPIRDLIKNQAYLRYLPIVFVICLALFLPQPLAPNYLQNQLGISVQTIGILGAVTNLGNVLISLLFGQLPPQTGLILGQISVGAFAFLLWKFSRLPILITGYFFLGGFRATRSLLSAQVDKMVSSSNMGMAYGILETVTGLAMVAAPPLAGVLYAAKPESIFSVSIMMIIPVLLFTLLRRKMPWKP